MKVTFVYPSVGYAGLVKPPDGSHILYIHHGISYLSACAKEVGFETSLIDLRRISSWDEYRKRVFDEKPDILAVTMISPDFKIAMEAIRAAKEVKGDIIVVVGGMHPTIAPAELAEFAEIDYVVTGEGEISFIELLNDVKAGKKGHKVIQGKRADVDNLPYIDRHLFDCLEYPFDSFLQLPFFTIMAGRGCSYNCKFCAPASKLVHGKGTRRRSVKSVMEELKMLKAKYGMRSFMFHDDCFTEDKEWVREFCSSYKQAKFTEDFICQTRADIICRHPDMIKRLVETGLKMAMIGFESGNDRVLKFIGKGVTARQNIEAARICRRNGIRIWALHMYGLPTETNAEAMDTVNMIRRIKPYRASAAFFTPHPGSYLYDYCKANDISLLGEHDDYVSLPEEEDRPKIKGVDYAFMLKAAAMSKSLPMRSKLMTRIDRAFRCRRNRRFLRLFAELEKRYPDRHKLELLALIKEKYPDA